MRVPTNRRSSTPQVPDDDPVARVHPFRHHDTIAVRGTERGLALLRFVVGPDDVNELPDLARLDGRLRYEQRVIEVSGRRGSRGVACSALRLAGCGSTFPCSADQGI